MNMNGLEGSYRLRCVALLRDCGELRQKATTRWAKMPQVRGESKASRR